MPNSPPISNLPGPGHICPFSGNADLYGIGVRSGFYLQWFSTLLITTFIPHEEVFIRVVNLLIQSAVFLGLLLTTIDNKIKAIETLITLWLLFGALSSLSGDGILPFDHWSGRFRILFYSAVSAYACWFWFVGLDRIMVPDCIVIAFFGSTPIGGWFRTAGKVLSILGLIICAVFFFLAIPKIRRKEEEQMVRPRVEIGLLLTSFILIIISIAALEHLLESNGISGINDILSVGQLIPLLVGSFSAGTTLFKLYDRGYWKRKRCWFLVGHHL
jgi:hypothetical protein